MPHLISSKFACRNAATMLALLLAIATGCGPEAEIRSYTVEKPIPKDRMLAAVVPQVEQETAWFFKLTGPNTPVAALEDVFSDFIASIRFEAGEPQWELPESWTAQPGSGLRFATIEIPSPPTSEASEGTGPLELSVTRLPLPSENTDPYLLSNINRWRGQLELPRISPDQLANESTRVPLNSEGLAATIVNFAGNMQSASPMGGGNAPFAGRNAPFAGGGAPFAGSNAPSVGGGAPAEPPKIEYEAPETWEQGQEVVNRGGISIRRQAAFNIGDGDQTAEVTVTTLPAAAGDLAMNVNRWRAQVQLPPLSPEELDEAASAIEFAGSEGEYVELIGPEQAILGVIAVQGDHAFFIKLQGNHDLALREREPFRTFVRSIQTQP